MRPQLLNHLLCFSNSSIMGSLLFLEGLLVPQKCSKLLTQINTNLKFSYYTILLTPQKKAQGWT